VFYHGYESLVTSEGSNNTLFRFSLQLNPELEEDKESRSSLRVPFMSLLQTDSALECEHEFAFAEEIRNSFSVESRVLPVLLNDSLNESTDIELTIKVVLVQFVTRRIGIVSVFVVIILLCACF